MIGIPANHPAGLSSVPHRRTGAPGRAAGHRGPHSVKSWKHRSKSSSKSEASRCRYFVIALLLIWLF